MIFYQILCVIYDIFNDSLKKKIYITVWFITKYKYWPYFLVRIFTICLDIDSHLDLGLMHNISIQIFTKCFLLKNGVQNCDF